MKESSVCKVTVLGWYLNSRSRRDFQRGGIGQQRQRLVGMAGEDDLVKGRVRRRRSW
jgi:hypothetical protein